MLQRLFPKFHSLVPASAVNALRWRNLAVGIFILMFVGFIYGWSVLAVPLQADFGWTTAQTALVFTVSTACYCIGGIIGSQVSRRVSPQLTLVLSGLLLCAGYMVSSLVTAERLPMLYVTYGILVGGSAGAVLNAVMGTVNGWFPDKVGTSSGFLTLGVGLGNLSLSVVMGALIELLGWRPSFWVIGLATAAVFISGSFFVRLPSPAQPLPGQPEVGTGANPVASRIASGDDATATEGSGSDAAHTDFDSVAADAGGSDPVPGTESGSAQASGTSLNGREYTTRQMLRQPAFYLTYAWTISLAAVYLGIMGNAKQIALEAGAVMTLATTMVGLISLFDAAGRLSSGVFFDRFGYRLSLVGTALLFISSAGVLFAAFSFRVLWPVFLGFALLGVSFGAISSVLAAVTNRFYGQQNYGSNLGLAYSDFVPASLIGPPLTGFIATNAGSFHLAFAALLAICSFGLLISFLIRPPR
jgi:OFA family oxalate/formate antiporter-like MFS transporter